MRFSRTRQTHARISKQRWLTLLFAQTLQIVRLPKTSRFQLKFAFRDFSLTSPRCTYRSHHTSTIKDRTMKCTAHALAMKLAVLVSATCFAQPIYAQQPGVVIRTPAGVPGAQQPIVDGGLAVVPQQQPVWNQPNLEPLINQPVVNQTWGDPWNPQQPTWDPPQQPWVDPWNPQPRRPVYNPHIHQQKQVMWYYDEYGNLVTHDKTEKTRASALDPNRHVVDQGSRTQSSSVSIENGFEVTRTTYRWTSYGKPHHRIETTRRRLGQESTTTKIDNAYRKPQ